MDDGLPHLQTKEPAFQNIHNARRLRPMRTVGQVWGQRSRNSRNQQHIN